MTFAVWLRGVIEALMRTPYLRSLEAQLERERQLSLEQMEEESLRRARERQDLTERLRDKDAVIADLKLRLAIAEADTLREKQAAQARQAARTMPVPEFDGPLSFQDELAQMARSVDEDPEGAQEASDAV